MMETFRCELSYVNALRKIFCKVLGRFLNLILVNYKQALAQHPSSGEVGENRTPVN